MVKRYEGTMEALSPIFHGGDEKTGSSPVLRTITLYNPELRKDVYMAYVSGNSIRGKLRRLFMTDMLLHIGLPPEDLPEKLYHSLFTGGVLESTDSNTGVVDLELRREVRKLLVPVSLFGAAVGNQMIQGKLIVGNAFPVCREYAFAVPHVNDPRKEKPLRTFLDGSFFTRKDDLKADRGEDEQAVQMKVDLECFVPGTLFYHYFALQLPTPLELSAFGRLMVLFKENPYIGGKSSTGYGEVRLNYAELPNQDEYMKFLKENGTKIKDTLLRLGEQVWQG